ncbi:hypothetical protein, partial [Escherichia coli]
RTGSRMSCGRSWRNKRALCMTEGNSEKKSGKQKSRVLMEKTPNRSGMFQNVSDIIREPGQEGG